MHNKAGFLSKFTISRFKEILIGILVVFNFSCQRINKASINPLSDQDAAEYKALKKATFAQVDADDKLVIQSAEFLLENLRYHYSLNGGRTRAYIDIIRKHSSDKLRLSEELRNLESQNLESNTVRQDASELSPAYLASNIGSALKMYSKNKVWAKDISFDNFQNYVLPYRIGTEPLSDWRSHFLKVFYKESDSTVFRKDLRAALNDLHTWLYNKKKTYKLSFGINGLNYPELPPQYLDQLGEGSCHELTYICISILRSLGIPATVEYIPMQLNLNNGHEWCSVVLNSGSLTFDMVAPYVNHRDSDYLPSKVYRKLFKPVVGNHYDLRGTRDYLPEFFNDPFSMDVTRYYTQTSNMRIPASPGITDNPDFCYLSVFNALSPTSWAQVGWGKVKGSDCVFKDVARKGVYLPVYFKNGAAVPLGSPVILRKNGTIKVIEPDTLHYQQVKLYRKFSMNGSKRKYMARMVGGRVQGSNFPDFRDARDMYTITHNPGEHFNTVMPDNIAPYRYIRYLSPIGGHGNLAELEFYEHVTDTIRLKGKVMGTPGSSFNDPKSAKEAAFDSNLLTYFDTDQADSVWTGIDLGKKTNIGKIRFIARTDMNAIQKGNTYELFYWNSEWKSLGKRIARDTFVVFNAPKGALLWLRNLTDGVEERIFTYEGKKQVWW